MTADLRELLRKQVEIIKKDKKQQRHPDCCVIEGGCMNRHHHGYRCNAGCELAIAYLNDLRKRYRLTAAKKSRK